MLLIIQWICIALFIISCVADVSNKDMSSILAPSIRRSIGTLRSRELQQDVSSNTKALKDRPKTSSSMKQTSSIDNSIKNGDKLTSKINNKKTIGRSGSSVQLSESSAASPSSSRLPKSPTSRASTGRTSSNFREGNFTRIMQRIVKYPKSCPRLPDATAIITTVTGSAFDLLMIRGEIMEGIEENCVIRNIVTVCLDELCMKLCKFHNIRSCTSFPGVTSTSYPIQSSNSTLFAFKTTDWRFVTYLKYEVFYSAFNLGVSSVLMLDADVLLLRNPFKKVMDMLVQYDILHQAELGGGCDAPINSGVLIMRNNEKNRNVVDQMLKQKDAIVSGKSGLEQYILEGVVKKVGATRCSLPKSLYTGHCQYAHEDLEPITNITTYHVHCTQSHEEKMALMYHFVHMSRMPEITFNQGELKRNYFDGQLVATDPDRPPPIR